LFLGLWLCHRIAVTADDLGEYRLVLFCMLVLSGAVQGAVSLEALSVSFSSTRYLGNSPGFEVNSDQLGLRDSSGNRNLIDDSSTE
jgi:hypothetical protein